jgi:hypothetical protein
MNLNYSNKKQDFHRASFGGLKSDALSRAGDKILVENWNLQTA